MFAQIIPLRKLPKSIDYFDYKVPKKLSKKIKIGQVVLIPFRRQKIKGIVINFKKTSNFKKVRAILNIIIDKPVINKNQIKLAKFISQYYFVSLSLIIKKIIPPLLKRPRPASKKGAEIKYKK